MLYSQIDNAVKNRWHLIDRYKCTDEESSDGSRGSNNKRRKSSSYENETSPINVIPVDLDFEEVVHESVTEASTEFIDIADNCHRHIEHDHDEHIILQHVASYSYPFNNQIYGYGRDTNIIVDSNPTPLSPISTTEKCVQINRKRPLSTFQDNNRKVFYCFIPTFGSQYDRGGVANQCQKDTRVNINDFTQSQLFQQDGSRNTDDSWIDDFLSFDDENKVKSENEKTAIPPERGILMF